MSYGLNLYGQHEYGVDINNKEEDHISKVSRLMKHLPWYYQDIRDMLEIQHSLDLEFDNLRYEIDDLYKQFFIDTATWGLTLFEEDLGLQTNIVESLEERREIIKAKLRGAGTTTKEMIKNTAEAFSGGEVDVSEYPEEEYFVVRFIGIKGIPRNMQAFINMLEDIKPSHLEYEFKYNCTTCQMLIDWNVTCSELKTKTCDDVKIYEKF